MARIQALSMAIAGTICTTAGLGITADSAQALVLTRTFQAQVSGGTLAGQIFSGSVTYDNAALTDPSLPQIDLFGFQIINRSNGLRSISFDFLGARYTESDDAFPSGYGSDVFYPNIFFKNNAFVGLEYLVTKSPRLPNPTEIADPVLSFFFGYDFANQSPFFGVAEGSVDDIFNNEENIKSYFGPVSFSDAKPIPTPALLPGLIGMGIAAFKKRKREAS